MVLSVGNRKKFQKMEAVEGIKAQIVVRATFNYKNFQDLVEII